MRRDPREVAARQRVEQMILMGGMRCGDQCPRVALRRGRRRFPGAALRLFGNHGDSLNHSAAVCSVWNIVPQTVAHCLSVRPRAAARRGDSQTASPPAGSTGRSCHPGPRPPSHPARPPATRGTCPPSALDGGPHRCARRRRPSSRSSWHHEGFPGTRHDPELRHPHLPAHCGDICGKTDASASNSGPCAKVTTSRRCATRSLRRGKARLATPARPRMCVTAQTAAQRWPKLRRGRLAPWTVATRRNGPRRPPDPAGHPLPNCPAGPFLARSPARLRLAHPNCHSFGDSFPMARKHLSAVPAKKQLRAARPPSAKPPLRAHQRLVHGFLVRLPPKPGIAQFARRSAETGKVRALRPTDAKHEGPADDATFH